MFIVPPRLPVGVHHRQLGVEVAMHEAGHYIVGRALGFKMGYISVSLLDLNGGHRAESEMTPTSYTPTIEALNEWMGKRVQQLYAGVFAQSLGTDGKVDADKATEFAKKGGSDDRAKAMVLIHLMRNTRFSVPDSPDELEKQLMDIHQPFWDASAELVEQEANLIIGLGEALGNKIRFTNEIYTLTVEELCEMRSLHARFPPSESDSENAKFPT